MTTTELQRKIAPLLPKGEDSFNGFIKEALLLRLQEVNQKIALFEGKYNKSFFEFKRLWKKLSDKKRHSYEIESDFLDWEALEEYKRDLMRVIYSL